MWKLKSYLLPSENYNNIKQNDVFEFENVVNKISEKDEFFVPKEFFELYDEDGISAAEYLFNYEYTNDVSQYLFEIIKEQPNIEVQYIELFQDLSILRGSFVNLGYNNIKCQLKNYIIEIKSDIVQIKRIYVKDVKNYLEFKERASDCYPNLIFHPDAFLNIQKLGNINSEIQELMRHLGVLCDVGKACYFDNNRDEKVTLNVLESKYNVICSGKGSNETCSYDKKMKFPNSKKEDEKNGESEFILKCNSHTKFYDGNNDQRIYFCWGRDEISDHDIIIVRIGDHWK